MTELYDGETILSRQLRMISHCGLDDIVITTGPFANLLENYCRSLELPLQFRFINNPKYAATNYIYSIFLAREALDDDLVLMHGDLVFDEEILSRLLALPGSQVVTSFTQPLPEKDFKAVIRDGRIDKIGVEFFDNAVFMQALYKLEHADWMVWLKEIESFCASGETGCYAENALTRISDRCRILPFDIKDGLCAEIDTPGELEQMRRKLLL